jgi:uncharacterized protein DUF4190
MSDTDPSARQQRSDVPDAAQPYGGQPSNGQPYGAQGQYATPGYAPGYGQPVAPYGYAYPPAPRTNPLAIVSFVSAFVVSIVAVITGHIALSQIKRTGEGGHGFALAGLIIGYVGIGFVLVFFIIWLILFLAVLSHGYATGSVAS